MIRITVLSLSLMCLPVFAHNHSHNHGHHHDHGHACEGHLTSQSNSSSKSALGDAIKGLLLLEQLKGTDPAQDAYFKKIIAAADAAVKKHDPLFQKDHHRHLDHARHQTILRAIAEVDANRLQFSAYKIKRAIEGRYSLSEYISCREK